MKLMSALLRFATTGVLSIGIDVVVLALLHQKVGLPLALAVSIAYFSSLVVNYTLNHNWVFEAEGNHHQRLLRYGCLVVVNYATTVTIVTGLSHFMYYLLAKGVAVAVNAVINFTGFRLWVFAPNREETTGVT